MGCLLWVQMCYIYIDFILVIRVFTCKYHYIFYHVLIHKQLEMHGCVLSTVATDALVLKHQAISIHIADEILILLDQFHAKILHLWSTTFENEITF